MSVWSGENFGTEAQFDVKPLAPGVGRIVCPECGGDQMAYRKLGPPELGTRTVLIAKVPASSALTFDTVQSPKAADIKQFLFEKELHRAFDAQVRQALLGLSEILHLLSAALSRARLFFTRSGFCCDESQRRLAGRAYGMVAGPLKIG
ncbi:MAG: hypothetical protein ACTHKE_09310 [Sphingomicrobium sp.]